MFRASLSLGHTPKTWQSTTVTFIPKAGKDDYSQPKSYRPISLMSFMLKTLEKIVAGEIFSKIKNKLSPDQHAYTKGKSTLSALHKFQSIIDQNVENPPKTVKLKLKKVCVSVFIDIEGAFDNTPTRIILKQLKHFKINEFLINWVSKLLSLRIIKATNGDSMLYFRPQQGCPQGGCLSPLLWNIVMDSLIKKLDPLKLKIVSYADDIVITAVAFNAIGACNKLSNAMKIVEEWCHETGLNVNPNKTNVLRSYKNPRATNKTKMTDILLFNTPLKVVEEIKYLGVFFDSKNNFKFHIEYAANKALRSLWACRAMVSKTWGLDPKKMMWVYKQIILPRVSYGSVVWWHKARSHKKELDKIQRTALMLITGAVKSTPTKGIESVLDVNPIHLEIYRIALNSAFLLISNEEWSSNNCSKGHLEIENKLKFLKINKGDPCAPQIISPKMNTKFIINSKDKWNDCHLLSPDPIIWYSDGSRKNNKAGAGILCINDKQTLSLRLTDEATSVQAELIGISLCARESVKKNYRNKLIIINTDCASAIQALNNKFSNSKTVIECSNAIKNIDISNQIIINWVPGHSKIDGNEKVDDLAKKGTLKTRIDIKTYNSKSIATNKINEHVNSLVENEWSSHKEANDTKCLIPYCKSKLNINRAKFLIQLNRKNLRVALGIITGHSLLKATLSRFSDVNDHCRFCNSGKETIIHIMTECNDGLVRIHRSKLLRSFFFDNSQDIRDIKFDIMKGIYFIKKVQLFKTFFPGLVEKVD